MLELSLILLAGATLILPSGWRQGVFWWLRLRKLAGTTEGLRGGVRRGSVGTHANRARISLFEFQQIGERRDVQ
jgi:hypothetical protein